MSILPQRVSLQDPPTRGSLPTTGGAQIKENRPANGKQGHKNTRRKPF
jgi:hypothetical protein